MPSTRIQANIPGVPAYDIRIGTNALDSLGRHMRAVESLSDAGRVLVITDENVAPLYLGRAKDSLGNAGYRVSHVTLPAGEEAKSVEVAAEVWEACAALGLGRGDALVALGGGVVGDLTGFVAATYMRGIPYAQVPTTLLAMVDSSVGGKTALNLSAGKNLVGAFHHPSYVCASPEVLASLPQREWACGLGELAKMAMVGSDELFFWVEDNSEGLAARDIELAAEAAVRSVVAKVDCVAADPDDSLGIRAALNYGHTLGHAIERLAGFGTFGHGQCVAQGMRFAADVSRRLVGMPPELADAQEGLLSSLGLGEIDLSPWRADEVIDAMHADKKAASGQVRMVLLSDIAAVQLRQVGDDVLRTVLEARGMR